MRALLIKMSSLGDVIHTLPAVTDAAAHGIEFDWVVEEAFADIAASHPAVKTVLPIAWRRWRKGIRGNTVEMNAFYKQLRSIDYDLVLDAQGLIKSAVVTTLAKGSAEGFSHTVAREPWAAFAYKKGHRIARGQHAIDRQRQLFAAAFGYTLPEQAQFGVESGQAGSSRQVFLLHGTTWQTKHWPVSMWQALAQQVRADGYEAVVTWGDEQERERAQQIAQSSGAQVLDRMPLAALAQRLAEAAMVIGVDSGLCHYSAALGTPTLGLYGPTDGVLTGCRGQRADIMQSKLACAPCLQSSCKRYQGEPLVWQDQVIDPPCFAELTPAQVWQKARTLMVVS